MSTDVNQARVFPEAQHCKVVDLEECEEGHLHQVAGQDTGMEVLKQARFGRSQSLLRWGHHIVLLALLPAYYWRPQGDPLLGLFFLCNAATIPRQLRWCANYLLTSCTV